MMCTKYRKFVVFVGLFMMFLLAKNVTFANNQYLGSFTFGSDGETSFINDISLKGYAFIPFPFVKWNNKLVFFDGRFDKFTGSKFWGGGGIGYRQLFGQGIGNKPNQLIGFYGGYNIFNGKLGLLMGYMQASFEYRYNRIFMLTTGYIPMGNSDKWKITHSYRDVPQAPEEDNNVLQFYLLRHNYVDSEVNRAYQGLDMIGGFEASPGFSIGAGFYYWQNQGKHFPTSEDSISKQLNKSVSYVGGLLIIKYDILGNPLTSQYVGRIVPFSRMNTNFNLGYDGDNGVTLMFTLSATLRTYPIPDAKGLLRHMVDPVWTRIPISYVTVREEGSTQKIYKRDENGEIAKYYRITDRNSLDTALNPDNHYAGGMLNAQLSLTDRGINIPDNFTLCGNTCKLNVNGVEEVFPTTQGIPKGPSFFQFIVTNPNHVGKKGATGLLLGSNDTLYDIAIYMAGTTTDSTTSLGIKTLGDAQAAIYNKPTDTSTSPHMVGTLDIENVLIYGGYIDLSGMTKDSHVTMINVGIYPGKITHLVDKLPDPNVYNQDMFLYNGTEFSKDNALERLLPDGAAKHLNSKYLPRSFVIGGLTFRQTSGTLYIDDMQGVYIGGKMSTVDTSLGSSGYYYNDMGGIIFQGITSVMKDISIDHIYLSRSSRPGELYESTHDPEVDKASRGANKGRPIYIPADISATGTAGINLAVQSENGSLYYTSGISFIGTGSVNKHHIVVENRIESIGQNSLGLFFKGNNNNTDAVDIMLEVKGRVKTTDYGGVGIFQDDGITSGILIDGGVITDGENASAVFVQGTGSAHGTLRNLEIDGGILTENYSSPGLDIWGTLDTTIIRSGIRAFLSDGIRNNAESAGIHGYITSLIVHEFIMSVGTVYTGTAGGPTLLPGNGNVHTGYNHHSGATNNVWSPSTYEVRNGRYMVQSTNTTNTNYRYDGWYLSADGIHLDANSVTEGVVVFGVPGYPFSILSTGYPIYVADSSAQIKAKEVVIDDEGTKRTVGIDLLAASYTSNQYGYTQSIGGRITFGFINFSYVNSIFANGSNKPINPGPQFGWNSTNVPAGTGTDGDAINLSDPTQAGLVKCIGLGINSNGATPASLHTPSC